MEARDDGHRGSTIRERVFLRGILAYLRRDFHPWHSDNLHLAQDYLAGVEGPPG